MSTKSILTTYGNNRILSAIATDTTVPVTAIVYGDGDYEGSDPSVSQTSLLHQIGKLTSVSKEFNDEEGFIYFKATIPANANEGQSFTLTEFGLLDDQNKVLTVTVIPGIEKPAAEDGTSIALPITIGFKTSTGEIMVIVEDGTDVYANTSLSNLNEAGQHHFDTTYASINLDNLSTEGERHFLGRTHITNCITEETQRILYTFNNGTLTLKANSIIVVPYGTTDLTSNYSIGSEFLNANFTVEATQYNDSKFFVWAKLQNDISITYNQGAYNLSVFVDATNNRLLCYNRSSDASGSSNPSGTVSFYNSSTNYLNRYSSGAISVQYLSFPCFRITSNSSKIVSIDEVFNGITHIGTTIIVDKDVRLLIPNGRNENGSLNNIIYMTETLTIQSNLSFGSSNNYTYFYFYTARGIALWSTNAYYKRSPEEASSGNRVYYDYATNAYTIYTNSMQYSRSYCELGSFTGNSTYITNFKSKYAFRAIDYNNFLEVLDTIDTLETRVDTIETTANTALSIANTAKAKADTSVQLTGTQTISGQKTFQNLVKVPASSTFGAALQLEAFVNNAISDRSYLQFGSGHIIQYGRTAAFTKYGQSKTITLRKPYKNGTSYVVIPIWYGSTDVDDNINVTAQTASTFTLKATTVGHTDSTWNLYAEWIAFGFE